MLWMWPTFRLSILGQHVDAKELPSPRFSSESGGHTADLHPGEEILEQDGEVHDIIAIDK